MQNSELSSVKVARSQEVTDAIQNVTRFSRTPEIQAPVPTESYAKVYDLDARRLAKSNQNFIVDGMSLQAPNPIKASGEINVEEVRRTAYEEALPIRPIMNSGDEHVKPAA